ncbi:collagen-binding domain-containing protein [Streptomyces sp. NPDC051684]|uniref:collagen-binding domain-containing protein n=1 Tax=Streptomyces sp. NPDC051684 TaxID=3365670 RepID=UPI0037B7FC81
MSNKTKGALMAAGCAACTALSVAAAAADQPAAAVRAAVSIGNPVAGNNGFGVVTENDAYLGSTESEGPVAVGGNLSFGAGYNVSLNTAGTYTAPGDARPTALLVGGRIDYGNSSPTGVLKVLQNGYLKIGDLTGSQVRNQDQNGASVNTHVTAPSTAYDGTPRIELSTQEPATAVGPSSLMDFPGLFGTYRDRATQMASCANNVTLLDGNGNPLPDQSTIPPNSQIKVQLDPGRTNVLHLTGAMLNNISTFTLLNQPTADAPFVIVVDTTAEAGNFTWHTPTMAGVGSSQNHILWDFPDATRITNPDGDQIEGTIYAPSAELIDLDPSNIEGDVIVKSLVQGSTAATGGTPVNAGEIHYHPFDGNVDCDDASPTPTPTDTPTPTPTDSPTPTPTDSPTPTPTPSPTDTPTPSPTTAPPTTPTPTPTSPPTSQAPLPSPSPSGPELAHTGADRTATLVIGGIAAALMAGGAGALYWSRRPRRNGHHN